MRSFRVSGLKFLLILLIGLTQSSLVRAADGAVSSNETTIREFLTAWSRLDADELAAYFTDDGVYYNMPTEPVEGRENIRAFMANFMGSWNPPIGKFLISLSKAISLWSSESTIPWLWVM